MAGIFRGEAQDPGGGWGDLIVTAALEALTGAYAGRADAGARWESVAGSPGVPRASSLVIGYVGGDVPVELLTAAGALPIRLWGDPEVDTAPGDLYLGRGLDPAVRSILTLLLAERYGRLDRIVVSRDCEASLRLFYALRELRRVEPSLGLPEAYLVDFLHLPHRTTFLYNRRRLDQLRERLVGWTGRPISDSDLEWAIERHDEQRRLLGEVAGLRRCEPASLSGSEFLAIVGAGTCMPVTAHIEMLVRLLAETGADDEPDSGTAAEPDSGTEADVGAVAPAARRGTRAFLTGSSHDTPHVYRALEGAGFVVVGEDHDWGDMLFERTVGTPTLDALTERYQYNGPTAQRATVGERARHTACAARRCRAQVLIGYARRSDEAPPWDFAAQRSRTGLPAVFVEHQSYGQIDLGQLSSLQVVAGEGA